MESTSANTGQSRDEREIKTPPTGFFSSLRYLGPGLILSAAIVGSGELIVTTTMGAKAGFVLLWVVLFGCMMKVAVQLEYGRYCICHGLPSYQAWNRVGAFKIFGIHWTVYAGVLYMISSFFGQAGVLGGAAQVGSHAFPSIALSVWVLILVVVLALLVVHGRYGPIEILATLLNFFFVFAVFYCLFQVQGTAYSFTLNDLASGLTFRLPAESLGLALAAFGITGVASGEITMYPYWCIEKGYAAWTGPRDDSPEWAARARGWIRVMTLDALISMVVYTLSTCAFYILGATVLSQQSKLADGNDLIQQLSAVFTEVMGSGAQTVFMLCAFAVLFSTIFSNTAAFSRLWTDFFGLCGWIDWHNPKKRKNTISLMACVFPLSCGLIYLTIQKPLFLVVVMGICNSIFLIVVAYQAIVFRYRHTDPRLKPSRFYDTALWISLLSIGYMAARTAYLIFA